MVSFFGITDYTTYLIGTIAIVLLPGPNSMYCLYVGSSQGIKRGYQTVAAIFLGDLILMTAAVLGAATLLKTSALVFTIFKAIGALYLAYLGINLIKAAYLNFKAGDITAAEIPQEQPSSISISKNENVFLKAFTLSISNPKAIMFFLSFFLQFIDPTYPNPALSFFILGSSLQMLSVLYLSVLIFAGAKMVSFFKEKPMLGVLGNGAVGALFIGFAVSLWEADTPKN